MICIDYLCDKCRHQRENIDGWKCACDAISDGIPNERLFYATVEDSTECSNGIEYEEKAEYSFKELKNKATIG